MSEGNNLKRKLKEIEAKDFVEEEEEEEASSDDDFGPQFVPEEETPSFSVPSSFKANHLNTSTTENDMEKKKDNISGNNSKQNVEESDKNRNEERSIKIINDIYYTLAHQ